MRNKYALNKNVKFDYLGDNCFLSLDGKDIILNETATMIFKMTITHCGKEEIICELKKHFILTNEENLNNDIEQILNELSSRNILNII